MDKTLDKIIKKHIILTCLTAVSVVLMMITITYGLYQTNHKNTTDQQIAIGDFDVDLTSSSGQITITDLKPGDAPNTTYTFTTTNSGDYYVAYEVYLNDNTDTFLQNSTNATTYAGYTRISSANYAYINYSLDGATPKPLSEIYESSTGRMTILSGRIAPNKSYNHTLTFSIASNAPNSLQGTILALNITMDAAASKETGVDKILNLVQNVNPSASGVITGTAPEGSICTNTLAYDETNDNNLRYVGINPCNYAIFNEDSKSMQKKWVIVEVSSGIIVSDEYDTEALCQAEYAAGGSPAEFKCQAKISNTWRIIGVMNGIDDGTGKKETRIKLVRTDSLGEFSWDTSDSNGGFGLGNWSDADLMQELNGDYLNTTLNANTLWYNGQNNQKEGVYNYTDGLKKSSQDIIGDTLWNLGQMRPEYISYNDPLTSEFYESEKSSFIYDPSDFTYKDCSANTCSLPTTWRGKVALPYVSDLGYAVGGDNRINCLSDSVFNYKNNYCIYDDWLYQEDVSKWLLDVSSNSPFDLSSGFISYTDDPFTTFDVFPTIYLKANAAISGGNGTAENPYILK